MNNHSNSTASSKRETAFQYIARVLARRCLRLHATGSVLLVGAPS